MSDEWRKLSDIFFFTKQAVMHCECDEFESAKIVVFASQPQDVMQPQNVYLVESSENLYGVFRYRNYIPSKLRHKTQWWLQKFFSSGYLVIMKIKLYKI